MRSTGTDDYPDTPAPYLQVAKMYANPLFLGPPICDELIALVEHMYTEEEALLVRHLGMLTGKSAAQVAAVARRPVEAVRRLLERLAYEKHVLLSVGTGDERRYRLLPLVPGAFEVAMVRTSLDTLTEWHRRFAELFSALYETGFLVDYVDHPVPWVRYVPVWETVEAHSRALPSNRLEEVLDRYHVFAVGLCQCRVTEGIVGRGCDRPVENCVAFGSVANYLIRNSKMRPVGKRDVLEIKAEATTAGLANFVAEIRSGERIGGALCSCCGCCCGALRTISQFNTPGFIAPPHFVPQVDLARCTFCARCAQACPVGATVVDVESRLRRYLVERCIGCGLCAVACASRQAIRMEPVATYRRPPRSLSGTLLQIVPNHLRNAWSVWRKRR